MKKREFGVSFAVEASPWPVTSPGWEWQTGIFLGGSPEDFAPFSFPFFIVLIVVGAWSLPSLFLVRVFRGESAPWPGRDVSLRITFFQAWAQINSSTTPVAKLCLGYSRRST